MRVRNVDATLVYKSQVDHFASVLNKSEESPYQVPDLCRFDVSKHPRFMQDMPGAERIYGPLHWHYIWLMQRRKMAREETEAAKARRKQDDPTHSASPPRDMKQSRAWRMKSAVTRYCSL